MKIIFAGTIGHSGLGGQAWASLQYLLGFRALGHDVYYLEDCGDATWDWEKGDWDYGPDYPSAYVQDCLLPFGFGDRWIYRVNEETRGMPLEKFLDICASADLLLMRATPIWTWRPEYDRPRGRAFIDVDPGFTQIAIANGDKGLADGVARCETRFTIGQRLGSEDCSIPKSGGPWLKTLPPVFLPEWPVAQSQGVCFSSVIRWQGLRDAKYDGVSYGQRDQEFPKFLELPRRTSQKFRLALMGTDPENLTRYGWEVSPGEVVSKTPVLYRQFIQQSRGEFSVPKHGYVAARSGWFSDRSVCYLASGRPVLMEDTGLRDWLTAGEGVIPFCDVESARAGVEQINSDYERHSRAARRLAEQVFSAERVLPHFLDVAIT